MYKYKLNNSYTVYVNWSYYSECAKICKDAHKKRKACEFNNFEETGYHSGTTSSWHQSQQQGFRGWHHSIHKQGWNCKRSL